MLLHLQDSYDAEVSLRHVDLCKVLLSARADVASLGWLWLGMEVAWNDWILELLGMVDGWGSFMIGTDGGSDWWTSQTAEVEAADRHGQTPLFFAWGPREALDTYDGGHGKSHGE